jgi:methylmalonyl-CoA mutase cobalamin-binding subunit
MLHLQQILHALSPAFTIERPGSCGGHRMLLLSAPSERNLLGVYMLSEFHRAVASEFFHHAGWDVWHSPPVSHEQLLSVLKAQWFDVVDLSASCAERAPMLARDLVQIRKASRNRQLGVIVGGPVSEGHAGFATAVGADAVGTDPRDILRRAEALANGCR